MPHIRIKRFGARDAKEHAAQHQKTRKPAMQEIDDAHSGGSSAPKNRGGGEGCR